VEQALITQEAAIRLLEQALADEDESIRETAEQILTQLRDQIRPRAKRGLP